MFSNRLELFRVVSGSLSFSWFWVFFELFEVFGCVFGCFRVLRFFCVFVSSVLLAVCWSFFGFVEEFIGGGRRGCSGEGEGRVGGRGEREEGFFGGLFVFYLWVFFGRLFGRLFGVFQVCLRCFSMFPFLGLFPDFREVSKVSTVCSVTFGGVFEGFSVSFREGVRKRKGSGFGGFREVFLSV